MKRVFALSNEVSGLWGRHYCRCHRCLSLYHVGQVVNQVLDTQRALERRDIDRAPLHKHDLAWRSSLDQHCVVPEAPVFRIREHNEHRCRRVLPPALALAAPSRP